MQPTLKDIAIEVGVSSQLVSYYLNHPDTTRVAKGTRAKIDDAVRRLNYRPNSMARALSTGKTMTIGLVMGGFAERKRGCYAHILMNEARELGYHLLITITNYDQKEERAAFESLINRGVDGVIYTLYLDPQSDLCARLAAKGFAVLMHRPTECPGFNTIGYDYHDAFSDMMRFIKRRGGREMVFVGGSPSDEWESLMLAARGTGLRLDFQHLDHGPRGADETLSTLLARRPPAVYCNNYQFLRDFLARADHDATDYRPDCVVGYSLPFEFVDDTRVVGAIHKLHRRRTADEIQRMVEIIENPGAPVRDHFVPTEFLARSQFDLLRAEQLRDPYYWPFR